MSGLDTKAIVEINQKASQFRSSIVICLDNKIIDAKSILGLSITLLNDQHYRLEIHGLDEAEAKAEMTEVFKKHHLSVTVN
ncbi:MULTISPECIES: HPr family phosphocarrier protein [Paenibacillus]|uniref:HPr family phosphocarrier protein n=1 Tax=Paenibacillus radicis (ex Xue et al. 2023) TaxID=2972489 RepID=A0ABT1YMP9_9BACL|nr:HPr family phosphocarrier protein [Paenibacillus radicis (ex Xue et al. 2023)]MCR8634302.1 HPr family phosphocarrier protein [Paenibacillus radicis (ex Xue et al. 2023)]